MSRQIFILSGTPYEDNRIPRDQWPALKDSKLISRRVASFENFKVILNSNISEY